MPQKTASKARTEPDRLHDHQLAVRVIPQYLLHHYAITGATQSTARVNLAFRLPQAEFRLQTSSKFFKFCH